MANTYHQLGRTAQDRGRLDEADDWYADPSPSKFGAAQPASGGTINFCLAEFSGGRID